MNWQTIFVLPQAIEISLLLASLIDSIFYTFKHSLNSFKASDNCIIFNNLVVIAPKISFLTTLFTKNIVFLTF